MPTGKACSQAAHAYLMAYLAADAVRQQDYHRDGLGTKICLTTPALADLLVLQQHAAALGLPHYLVEDTGRNTTFGGNPTVSALGIGPLTRQEAKFLRHLPLLP